jgi:hypothetical protein
LADDFGSPLKHCQARVEGIKEILLTYLEYFGRSVGQSGKCVAILNSV